jgi:hypothetical protein
MADRYDAPDMDIALWTFLVSRNTRQQSRSSPSKHNRPGPLRTPIKQHGYAMYVVHSNDLYTVPSAGAWRDRGV